jgi:site-specific DNA-methyltransferase (adenine-specific)
MAKNLKVHYSSAKDDWTTPDDLFSKINDKYGPFYLDPAADNKNAKCPIWFTEAQNGLAVDWYIFGSVFVNPPYSNLKAWIKKSYDEAQKGCRVVMLIPARTDTIAFHEYVMKARKIELIKGRIKFSNSKNSAPFPSMIVVFEKGNHNPKITSWIK